MIGEFTTLVGLIAAYKQLRDGREAKDAGEFKQWLILHKFEDLSEEIARSHHLNNQLNDLLRLDSSEILAKLQMIEDVVVSVSKKIDGLQGLASTFNSEAVTDQALSVLRLMNDSQSGTGVLFERRQEFFILLLPQGQGTIQPSENRFFRDDISQLVSLGWLALVDHTSNGDPKLQVTRAGAKAIQEIKKDNKMLR